MKILRVVIVALAMIVAIAARAADDAGVKVTVLKYSPKPGETNENPEPGETNDHVKPGGTRTIKIDIDIQTKPPMRDSPGAVVNVRFNVSITRGALTNASISFGTFGVEGEFFVPPTLDHYWRAVSQVTLTYKAPQEAGEVIISVEGQQGAALSGTTPWSYRGQAKLFVMQTPGGGTSQPVQQPPFTPTAGTVNPTQQVIDRLKPVSGILAAAGIVTYAGRRGRRRGAPKTQENPPQPPTAQRDNQPKKKEDDNAKPSAGVSLHIKPTNEIQVASDTEAPRVFQYRGDASEFIEAAVLVVPSAGFSASCGDYRAASSSDDQWQEDPSAGWYTGQIPPDADIKYFRIRIPWQWDDVANYPVQPPSFPYKLIPKDPKESETQMRASVGAQTVAVLGANPKLLIQPDQDEVAASGWNSFTITPTLWLFNQPADLQDEQIKIESMTAKVGEEKKEFSLIERKPRDVGQAWVPPFLVQKQGYVDEAELVAKWSWTGGKAWQSATEPRRSQRPMGDSDPAYIDLVGCSVRTEPVTTTFCPLPQTPLYAKAWLVDGYGDMLTAHAIETDSRSGRTLQGSLEQDGVTITCEVRDRSSGPHSKQGGAKIPPKSDLDVGAGPMDDAAAQAQLKSIMGERAPDRTLGKEELSVGNSARIFTPQQQGKQRWIISYSDGGAKLIEKDEDDPEQILLMNYDVKDRARNDPIHDAPVFYTIIVKDGCGGQVSTSNCCRVALGSLVLETGGADFKIYEYQPHLFEVEYQPGMGYVPNIHMDQSVKLSWEFALVGDDGKAVKSGSQVTTQGTLTAGRFPLVVGHMRSDRVILVNRKNAKVKYYKSDDPHLEQDYTPYEWVRVNLEGDNKDDVPHRTCSSALRAIWHTLPTQPDKALEWMPTPGEGTDHAKQWTDRTVALGVRVELRNKDGYLLATSDRIVGDTCDAPPDTSASSTPTEAPPDPVTRSTIVAANSRTPYDLVWGDHRFKYVLKMLRLQLVDHFGPPYAQKNYRLIQCNSRDFREDASGRMNPSPRASAGQTTTTGPLGIIEAPIDANIEFAILKLGDEGEEGVATLNLKLGHVPPDAPASTEDIKARLNNLGFFAQEEIDEQEDETYARALQRFQFAYQDRGQLEVSGQLDATTLSMLRKLDEKFESHYEIPSVPTSRTSLRKPGTAKYRASLDDSKPIFDPDCPYPPKHLSLRREALVPLHLPTTLRVPHDTMIDTPPWFPLLTAGDGAIKSEFTPLSGNNVTYLIGGKNAFKSMAQAIRTATTSSSFVYLIAWLVEDVALDGPSSNLLTYLLPAAASNGAEVRALLWKNIQGREISSHMKSETMENLGLGWMDPLQLAYTPPRGLVEAAGINGIHGNAAALVDDRTRDCGSHHQKILIVNGSSGVIAFCGGMDICGNRLTEMFDVQCRIEGPAALALLNIFVERWNDQDRAKIGQAKRDALEAKTEAIQKLQVEIEQAKIKVPDSGWVDPDEPFQHQSEVDALTQKLAEERAKLDPLVKLAEQDLRGDALYTRSFPRALANERSLPGERHKVQIARTYGNVKAIDKRGHVVRPEYRFSPKGEKTVQQQVLNAIRQARRFIYIEDQYFSGTPDLHDAIAEALPRIRHLTMLMPHESVSDQGKDKVFVTDQGPYRTQQFLKGLLELDRARVHAFCVKPSWNFKYVHSKLYIIDDEIAIIGSANCSRRSFTHDSEVMAAICDEPADIACGYNFAHRLRIALWAYHIFNTTGDDAKADAVYAELADGVASVVHWLNLPADTHLIPYNESAPRNHSGTDFAWDNLVDPVGP